MKTYYADDLIIAFLLGILITLAMTACFISITKDTYKYGQIDAIKGKIKYHLVKQEDGSTIWERIDNKESAEITAKERQ